MTSRQKLRKINGDAVRRRRNKNLVVDFSKVNHLDSTGLGVMVGGLKRFREVDGGLVLVAPSPHVLRLFVITGLDQNFDICAATEDAIAKF